MTVEEPRNWLSTKISTEVPGPSLTPLERVRTAKKVTPKTVDAPDLVVGAAHPLLGLIEPPARDCLGASGDCVVDNSDAPALATEVAVLVEPDLTCSGLAHGFVLSCE